MKNLKHILSEVRLNDYGRGSKPERSGHIIPKYSDLGEKIGKIKGHDVYKKHFRGETDINYSVIHPKTRKNVISLNATVGRNKVHKHFSLSSGHTRANKDKEPKAHDLYHHLLKHGHASALVGSNQSHGAKRVWQKLTKKSGVTVHGWHKGKPVNLDPQDEMETHASERDARGDREATEVMHTKLVASYKKIKKK